MSHSHTSSLHKTRIVASYSSVGSIKTRSNSCINGVLLWISQLVYVVTAFVGVKNTTSAVVAIKNILRCSFFRIPVTIISEWSFGRQFKNGRDATTGCDDDEETNGSAAALPSFSALLLLLLRLLLLVWFLVVLSKELLLTTSVLIRPVDGRTLLVLVLLSLGT